MKISQAHTSGEGLRDIFSQRLSNLWLRRPSANIFSINEDLQQQLLSSFNVAPMGYIPLLYKNRDSYAGVLVCSSVAKVTSAVCHLCTTVLCLCVF